MPVKVTNSLSKEKEELVPIKGKKVRMYSCGVTVYDQCHIGHARSLYVFDIIKRYLKYKGFKVVPIKLEGYLNVDSGTLNPGGAKCLLHRCRVWSRPH